MTSELTVAPVISPMYLIQQEAAKSTPDVALLKELFDLKLRVEADEARKAFNEAFTAFKAEPIRIVKDKENLQYSKPGKPAMYASLEGMVATVTPFLSKYGLSARWKMEQNAVIRVTCILTHQMGHSESVTMDGPPDESGAKNKLQQIKSTSTYLKTTTFEAVCGLATEYGNLSDDGNGAGSVDGRTPRMSGEEIDRHLGLIEEARTLGDLKEVYRVAYKASTDIKDNPATKTFVAAYGKRKAEVM